MSSKDPKNPVIYAVFTTSRYNQVQTFSSSKYACKGSHCRTAWRMLVVWYLFCWSVARWSEVADIEYIQQATVLDKLFPLNLKSTHALYLLSNILPFHVLCSFPLSVFSNHFKWDGTMRATKHAPVKFPNSAPHPIIHLLYRCPMVSFPLVWHPPHDSD